MAKAHTVLVGDVGGTNCRLQCWELDDAFHPTTLVKEQASADPGRRPCTTGAAKAQTQGSPALPRRACRPTARTHPGATLNALSAHNTLYPLAPAPNTSRLPAGHIPARRSTPPPSTTSLTMPWAPSSSWRRWQPASRSRPPSRWRGRCALPLPPCSPPHTPSSPPLQCSCPGCSVPPSPVGLAEAGRSACWALGSCPGVAESGPCSRPP